MYQCRYMVDKDEFFIGEVERVKSFTFLTFPFSHFQKPVEFCRKPIPCRSRKLINTDRGVSD